MESRPMEKDEVSTVPSLGECPEPRPVLLVEKTDRLYRNIKDWVTIGHYPA